MQSSLEMSLIAIMQKEEQQNTLFNVFTYLLISSMVDLIRWSVVG